MPCAFAAFKFCCPTGCVYGGDNMDHPDSTTLDPMWVETAGDWDYNGNRLRIVATPNAKVTCTTLAPGSSKKYLVSASITLGTDGDVARVYVDDSAFFAELERITSTCGRLRLYDGTTCKGSCGVSLGGYTRLVMCVEATKVHVGTGGSPMLTVPATPASSIVALGTGACTGTVYFEDFSLSKHFDDDATCPACGNEGCTWFSDNGCASGSLSAADYTATGTWEYANGLKCTADGAITVVPVQPLGLATYGVYAAVPLPATGVSVKLYYDSTLTDYIEIDGYISGVSSARVRWWSGGVEFCPEWIVSQYATSVQLSLCFDGTTLMGRVWDGYSDSSYGLPGEPTTLTPKVNVSGLTGGVTQTITSFVVVKAAGDIGVSGVCLDCGTPDCLNCEPGTYPTFVRVVLAGLTSTTYGCACNDIIFTGKAKQNSTWGCEWLDPNVTDPGCMAPRKWSLQVLVVAVTGGYKLRVNLSLGNMESGPGVSLLFEETVLSGSPVDCMTVFDGDIPLVSQSTLGTVHCDYSAATCTFTSPAP
jgi:hypothetical protein